MDIENKINEMKHEIQELKIRMEELEKLSIPDLADKVAGVIAEHMGDDFR